MTELRLDALLDALAARPGALTDAELCDALWLATLLPAPAEVAVEEPEAPPNVKPGEESRDPEPRETTDTPPPAEKVEQPASERPPLRDERRRSASLELPSPAPAGPGLAFRTPGAAALPDALALVRALRPFRRRVRSRRQFELDEEATARRIVEEGLRLPVLRPAKVRWFDLALVVDGAASMAIWTQMVGELVRLFAHLGAFRDVRAWTLESASDGPELLLYAGPSRARPRDPRELVDPTGRRVIVVLTDGVAGAWHDGRAAALLDRWAAQNSVAIVSVLPERLWSGTALRAWPAVTVRARRFGEARVHLSPEMGRRRARGMGASARPIPIASLEPASLATLARVLTGAGHGPAVLPELRARSVAATGVVAEPDAAERVRRFDRLASPKARDLARLFAAAPLNLPVMRLILRAVLPGATQAHLAEVFLGGLLEEVAHAGPRPDADAIEYDLKPGVRDELLRTGDLADTMAVLHHVSSYIAERIGQPLDFGAVLVDPSAVPQAWGADRMGRAFARVASEVLERLGGDYAALAERLTELVTPGPTAAAPAASPASHTAFRGEFVWILGSSTEPSPAQRLAAAATGRALARHGFGVLSGMWWRDVDENMLAVLSSSRAGQRSARRERVIEAMTDKVVAAIAIGGAAGTWTRIGRARYLGLAVHPFPGTGGSAARLADELGSGSQVSYIASAEEADRVAEALFAALLRELTERPAPPRMATRHAAVVREFAMNPSPDLAALDGLRSELEPTESRPSLSALSELLTGARPEERAIVYLCESIHPHLALFDLVVERVIHETQQAVAVELPGVFMLGLAALERYCEVLTLLGHVDILERAAIDIARILRGAENPMDFDPEYNRVLALKDRALASPDLWTTVQARNYVDIRQAEPSSPERTRKLEALFAEVQRISEGDDGVTMATLRALFDGGDEGKRAVALMMWYHRPDLAPGQMLAAAIRTPRSAFEQSLALLAADRWLSTAEMPDPVIAAVLDQALDPNGLLNQSQTNRREMGEELLRRYGVAHEGRFDSTRSTLHRWRGEILGRAGDRLGALAALRQAEELAGDEPDQTLVQVTLGNLELEAGMDETAAAHFQRALKRTEAVDNAALAEARLLALIGCARTSERLGTLSEAPSWTSRPPQQIEPNQRTSGSLLEWCQWLHKIADAVHPSEASKYLREALQIARSLESNPERQISEQGRSLVQAAQHRLQELAVDSISARADSGRVAKELQSDQGEWDKVRFIEIPLRNRQDDSWIGELRDEDLLGSGRTILAVDAKGEPEQIAGNLPELAKIASWKRIPAVVKNNTPGARLRAIDPPPNLPVWPQRVYFTIDDADPYWREILAERTIAIYFKVPSSRRPARVTLVRELSDPILGTPVKLNVLLVSASPNDAPRIQFGREFDTIIRKVRATPRRDHINFVQIQAATLENLRDALLEYEPHVLHISSHGTPNGELMFEGLGVGAAPVSAARLLRLMRALRDNLRLIVLNASHSAVIARNVPPAIDLAVGMNDAVSDDAAIDFASSFYEALSYGRSVESAFFIAGAALNRRDGKSPQLFPPVDNDPEGKRKLVLVRAPPLPAKSTPAQLTVLLVSASPDPGGRLRADIGFRDIIEKSRTTRLRDHFRFVQCTAEKFDDLSSALLTHEPHVLHINCQVEADGSLVLDESGSDREIVSKSNLLRLLTVARDSLRLVVIVASHSVEITSDIPPIIDLAIGMSASIRDDAAITFATSFYGSLGYGSTVERAFDVARAGLEDGDDEIPMLFPSADRDPDGKRQLVLVKP